MIFSAKTNKYGTKVYNTYAEILTFFSKRYFNSDDMEKGNEFFYSFGEYLEDFDVPCDKLVLNVFTGYNNKFGIILKNNGERAAYVLIEAKPNGIFRTHYYHSEKTEYEQYKSLITDYFDALNETVFNEQMNECNLSYGNENSVEVDEYVDYVLRSTKVIKGSIKEIFDTFVTMNDHLKYCNGEYYKFRDDKVYKLYCIFIDTYKGNFFIQNAVKRGVIID